MQPTQKGGYKGEYANAAHPGLVRSRAQGRLFVGEQLIRQVLRGLDVGENHIFESILAGSAQPGEVQPFRPSEVKLARLELMDRAALEIDVRALFVG